MKKLIILLILVLPGLVGCAQVEGKTEEQDQSQNNAEETNFSVEDIKDDDIVASLHHHEITGKDLFYERKRLELIAMLQGEGKEFEEVSPNVAIQELIRNHMIHEIAKEQEITINQSDQKDRAHTVREDVELVDGYESVMEDIDEELFWSKEESRYEFILEAEMLISQLMEAVKKEHPTYTEQALRFDAQEELDELIQQKLEEANVEVYLLEDS